MRIGQVASTIILAGCVARCEADRIIPGFEPPVRADTAVPPVTFDGPCPHTGEFLNYGCARFVVIPTLADDSLRPLYRLDIRARWNIPRGRPQILERLQLNKQE